MKKGLLALAIIAIILLVLFYSNTQMTKERAEELALRKINENSPIKMAIKEAKEKPDGWIFYYDSEQAIITGDWQKYGVPGNIPLFVGKDGNIKYISDPNDPILD